jgi:hypothetical protein
MIEKQVKNGSKMQEEFQCGNKLWFISIFDNNSI